MTKEHININHIQSLAEYLLKNDAPDEIIRNLSEIILYCNELELDALQYSEQIRKLIVKMRRT